jgi:hypothetical protein
MKYCEKILYKNAVIQFNSQKNDSNDKFKPFGAVITFETTYNRQDYLCIYLDINIYAGKGRGNAVRKTHIWEYTGGVLAIPERFIKFTKSLKIKICEYICNIMTRQIENGEEYYSKCDLVSVYKYLNLKNFYLNDKGYSFFFPQNTVAPHESGIVSVVVPDRIVDGGEYVGRDALGAPLAFL